MTIKEALAWGMTKLAQTESGGAQLDAQALLGYVLQVERVILYSYPERLLTPAQEQCYRQLIERRLASEPIAYIVGHKEFYGRDFLVDRRVLIPRPETELLVEAALIAIRDKYAAGQTPIVADIGTGSGIIPITLAIEEPRLSSIYAVDISTDALEVARLNSERYRVEKRIHFLEGDLLAALTEAIDVLIANLPYVGTNEIEILTPDVWDYEPHLALFSGTEGLDLLYRLFVEAQRPNRLNVGAVVLLEIGYQQQDALARLLADSWPQAQVTFVKDFAGWNRLLKMVI